LDPSVLLIENEVYDYHMEAKVEMASRLYSLLWQQLCVVSLIKGSSQFPDADSVIVLGRRSALSADGA
jgi:hypothetical protein